MAVRDHDGGLRSGGRASGWPRRVAPGEASADVQLLALGRERDVGAVVRALELDVVDRLVDPLARLA